MSVLRSHAKVLAVIYQSFPSPIYTSQHARKLVSTPFFTFHHICRYSRCPWATTCTSTDPEAFQPVKLRPQRMPDHNYILWLSQGHLGFISMAGRYLTLCYNPSIANNGSKRRNIHDHPRAERPILNEDDLPADGSHAGCCPKA